MLPGSTPDDVGSARPERRGVDREGVTIGNGYTFSIIRGWASVRSQAKAPFVEWWYARLSAPAARLVERASMDNRGQL